MIKNLLKPFVPINYILFTNGYKLVLDNEHPFKVHHEYDDCFTCINNQTNPSSLLLMLENDVLILGENGISSFVFNYSTVLMVSYAV